ncbi:hypothetical protein [Nonomuraea sp. NPDC050786]|uniref:hypothetical protein n=1 Tax=Nonomuraea sp. NPDC050786 TaxID=3154840 RepID=UPI0033CB2169
MSKSPKYSSAEASRERRERRERERAERERRRREKLERQRLAALERARTEVLARTDVIAAACADLAARAAVLPEPGRYGKPARKAEKIRKGVAAATGLPELAEAGRRLDELEQRQAALAVELTGELRGQATDQVEAVSAALESMAEPERRRFDAKGAAEVAGVLAELRSAAAAGDAVAVRDRADAASELIGAHLLRAIEGRNAHERARQEAELALDRADARLAALEDDARATGVPLQDLELARAAVTMLRVEQDRERYAEVTADVERLDGRLDAHERELDDAIARITERRQLLTSIVQTLPRLGFIVEAGTLQESPDGAIGVRAHRRSGDAVAVVVEASGTGEHRILYLSDALAAAQERGGSGTQECVSLLDLAERANATVRTEGFDVGQVEWDDRGDPRPPGGAAMRFGPGAPQARRHGTPS